MRHAPILLAVLAPLIWSCARGIHTRTSVETIRDGSRFDHPATVPVEIVGRAIEGYVAEEDRPGMARDIADALRTMRPDEAIYYRNPHGGGYRIGVRSGLLLVLRWSNRPRGHFEDVERVPIPPPAADTSGGMTSPGGQTGIRAEYVGGEIAPTLEVQNDYPVEQHVFVDGREVGTVPTGSTVIFPLAEGSHEVVSADSRDPTDNPVGETIAAERGHRYGWRIYQTTVSQ